MTELEWGSDAFAVWSAGGAHFLAGQNLFKHAPAIGEALAAMALGEPAEIDLSPDARLGAAAARRLNARVQSARSGVGTIVSSDSEPSRRTVTGSGRPIRSPTINRCRSVASASG